MQRLVQGWCLLALPPFTPVWLSCCLYLQEAGRAAIVVKWIKQMHNRKLNEEQQQGYVGALLFAKALSERCGKSSTFKQKTHKELLFLPNCTSYEKYFSNKITPTN